ncbi:hypothetical protein CRM22_009446 [Opisthorchis felineus]|uniref:UBC core domain-containing protein n=1 Tax=Opisthorchis felineus TaxID=147828 RepID=A0A4S2L7L1_OPIFE|nr:hypothetical protein CRM22_009446 [Opisthorchis felineus]
MASKKPQSSAVKALQKELLELNATPVEGFKVNISSVENMFVWDVAIFGPPKTLYEGGYFKARLFFPPDYPYSPPSMQFLTKMFHPNIYADGEVCISILHSPGEDPQSDELASERWNPTQNVRTILLSVISLLNEPNIHSAAHVDASISYRKWKESNGKENEFEQIVRSLVHQTHADAEKDGVHVPTTVEEYCVSGRPGNDPDQSETGQDGSDFDDYYEYYPSDVDDADEDDDAACSESLDAGADSAMEENEGEVAARPKHNAQPNQSAANVSPGQRVGDGDRESSSSQTSRAASSVSKATHDSKHS